MPEQVDLFERMMREMVREEGGRLLTEEQAWRGRVPKNVDTAVKCALAAPTAAKAAAAAGGGHAIRTAIITLAAAVAVTGGAYTAFPAFRAGVSSLFGGGSAATAEQVPSRTPGSYTIPSPGGEFGITDEARSDSVQYKWFTSDKQDILVEIAYNLPEAVIGESVTMASGIAGVYSEDGGTKCVVLHDGGVEIRIAFSGAEREEVFDYAEALLAANAG